MTRGTRLSVWALASLLVLATAIEAKAQLRYDRGQNVAPVFEGWERNPDGTFTMVFGYLNRNYEEMPEAPIGPDNSFEPGPISACEVRPKPRPAVRTASTPVASSSTGKPTARRRA